MQRYIRGLMLAFTAGALWACGDDPNSEGAGDVFRLVANPAQAFVETGDDKSINVELLDQQGAASATTFAVSDVTPGITAVIDESFNEVYDENGQLVPPTSPTRARILITADSIPGNYQFTVSAGGQSEVVEVHVVPSFLDAAFSTLTPGLADTVTLTITPGIQYAFESGATISSPGAATPYVVDVAPDGSSLRFVTPPNYDVRGIIVHGVKATFLDASVPAFDLEPLDKLTSPAVPYYDVTLTPQGDGSTVLEVGPDWRILPGAVVTHGFVDTLFVLDATDDSLTVRFLEPINVDADSVRITGVSPTVAPFFHDLRLPGDDEIAYGAPASIPGTDDPGTAPTFSPSASLGRAAWNDAGTLIDQFYWVDFVEQGDYDVTLDWSNSSDLDLLILDDAFNFYNTDGATGDQPEHAALEETPAGTSLLFWVNVYDGAIPDFITVLIEKL